MRAPLPQPVSQSVPIFKVAADQGTHPRVGLDRPVCVVGRKEPANLPLPAKEVSKLHALIVREQRRVYLRDLASTNGVEVNGAAVREVGLSDADIVRIGSYTLKCETGFGRNGRRGADGANGVHEPPPPAELRGKAGNFSFADGRHTLLIGRRAACDVRLEHPSVAPVHAVVFEMDGRHYVQTFAPETATRVNGRPVHREALQAGDELLIGQVALRYELLDLSAETSGAAPLAMTDTGDSLIRPALDSSITPAIDPAHHGELELDDDVEPALDVVDGAHESVIAPVMGSSIAPAVGTPVAAAGAAGAEPAAAEEDYGLDIEPMESIEMSDGAPAPAAAAGSAAGEAKRERPAAPPRAAEPPEAAIAEPVIEPVVERAIESTHASPQPAPSGSGGKSKAEQAMNASMELEPMVDVDADPAAPGATGGAAAAAEADAPLELEPIGSSGDLEPIGLGGEQDRLFDNELEESFRAKWEAAGAQGQSRDKLSATFDEDNALEPVSGATDGPPPSPASAPRTSAASPEGPVPPLPHVPSRKQPAHDPQLSATFDEDNALDPVMDLGGGASTPARDDAGLSASFDDEDGLVPLTEPLDDAGLLGVEDHIDLVPELESDSDGPPAAPPAPAPAPVKPVLSKSVENKMPPPPPPEPTESPLRDSLVGALPVGAPVAEVAPTSVGAATAGVQNAAVAAADAAAAAVAAAAAAATAANAAAAAAGTSPAGNDAPAPVTVDALSSQAAGLAELAKAAGLGEDVAGKSREAAKAGDASPEAGATAEEITLLVEEVAEKAQVLKEAWEDFRTDGSPSTSRPTRTPPSPPS